MKRSRNAWAIVLLCLSLAGCSGSEAAVSSSSETDTAVVTGSDEAAGTAMDLSEEGQLMLGTMLLEETEESLSQEQAEDLLFLWRAYDALLNDETAADEELDALVA